MLLFIPVLFYSLTSPILAQTSCQEAGNKGPAINGGCPPATPPLTPTDDGDCCEQGFINGAAVISDTTTTLAPVVVTVAGGGTTIVPVTAFSSTICQDKVNPRTGISDCSQRANLCSNTVYASLMAVQCPKTCQKCTPNSSTNSTCQDMPNPRTGVSDCPSLKYLCNDSNYLYVMKVQCPVTCNLCSTIVAAPVSGCVDLINPVSNTSDCPRLKSLCKDATYLAVMQKQCQKTCGFCSG